jgi:site-specific recombinase XerD
MSDSQYPYVTAFVADLERYLVEVRGLARNSCRLHLRVVRGLLETCFTTGVIRWSDLRFEQIAEFLTKEFHRLSNHWTQRAWLMAVRGFIRYLEAEGCIPYGWGDALPKRISWKQASLPRCFSPDQMQALWDAVGNRRTGICATVHCCLCSRDSACVQRRWSDSG